MAVPPSTVASSSSTQSPYSAPQSSGSQTKPPETVPAVQWDRCLLNFFRNAGLTECCKALELDMLVMSQEQERLRVPAAIGQLVRDFTTPINPHNAVFRELEERKPDYLMSTKEPVSRKAHVANIARFLAQTRQRNERSNRSEFLRETGIMLPPMPSDEDVDMNGFGEMQIASTSSARTAAKPINRDIQMQYDIVKNVEGPLRRTTGKGKERDIADIPGQGLGGRLPRAGSDQAITTFSDHPGLEERFSNIEDHLAVRYVPAPPEDLYYRVKALEDRIIQLEKDYPPWSALQFNQPQRSWPPAPQTTPIIIPTHLTALEKAPLTQPQATPPGEPAAAVQEKPKKSKASRSESSLRRAVMEKLEVQKALNELKGRAPDRGNDGVS